MKVIHIAGTNGKGSTALIISSVLTEAGYRTGSFTSPHLHTYRERISIDGQPIAGTTFLSYLDKVRAVVEVMKREKADIPTEFEVLTAVALRYFADEMVDVVVLEVGMGGRYDSTNVVYPLAAVITRVERDHVAYLGQTLGEIAYNKAGIIKAGADVVIGEIGSEALSVIMDECQNLGAHPWKVAEYVRLSVLEPCHLQGWNVDIQALGLELQDVFFSLPGTYQLDNLRSALLVISLLRGEGWKLGETAIRRALGSLKWPGRLEVVHDDPLVLIDAAHNPDGVRALAVAVEQLMPARSRVLVCGIVDDKEAGEMLPGLSDLTRVCVITRPRGERSRNWRDKIMLAQEFFPAVLVEESIEKALERALRECRNDEYVLVTGSFYILDAVRQYFT
jgi:dihydrofolate synthase/folylpolyglutamate synthase